MKKRIVILTVLLVFTASVSFAMWDAVAARIFTYLSTVNPTLAGSIIDSVKVHAVGLGLLYAWRDTNPKAKVTPDGKIKKPMEVYYVPPPTPDGKVPVKAADINGTVDIEDIRAESAKDKAAFKAKFPYLGEILEKNDAIQYSEYYDQIKNQLPGRAFELADGTFHKAGSLYSSRSSTVIWTDSSPATAYNRTVMLSGKILVRHITGTGPRPGFPADNHISTFDEAYYLDGGLVTPDKIPTSNPEAVQKAANSPSPLTAPTDVYSDALGADIDDFIKDNPNIVHFEDDSGVPAVPDTATQYEIDRAMAVQSAQDAVAKADTAATNARNRANNARAASDASPGDGALRAAADAAEAAADAAEAAAAAARAAAAKLGLEFPPSEEEVPEEELEEPTVPGNGDYNSDFTSPDKKSITELLADYVSGSPLGGMVRSFTITTAAPVTEVDCGTFYGQEIKFSFVRYIGTFETCGGVLLVICHGFAILVVMRGW